MQHERRFGERKSPGQLSYIELSSANGGIVLNVSEGGLGFQLAAPVNVRESIPFWFSPTFVSPTCSRIEATGEVAWTDETRKTGGLRFTQLPSGFREQIQSWPKVPGRPVISSNSPVQPIELLPESPARVASAISQRTTPLNRPDAIGETGILRPEGHAQLLSRPNLEEPNRTRFRAIGAALMALMFVIPLSYYMRKSGPNWLQGTSSEMGSHAIVPRTSSIGDMTVDRSKTNSLATRVLSQSSTTGSPQTSEKNEETVPAESSTADGSVRNTPLPTSALIVQVGAFAHEADARRLTESLRQQNFPVFVRTDPTSVFYRVQIGPYKNQQSARVAQNELERAGFKSFIRH